jgi:hypothetical protein
MPEILLLMFIIALWQGRAISGNWDSGTIVIPPE